MLPELLYDVFMRNPLLKKIIKKISCNTHMAKKNLAQSYW